MILISLLTLNQDLFLIIIAVLSSPTLNPMAFSFVLTIYGMNAGGVLKKKTAKNCLTLTCCFCTCNSCPMSLSLCLSACNMLSNSSILWFLNSSSSLSVSTSAWSRSNNQVTCNNPICFATAVLISLIAKLQIVEVLHRKTKPVVSTLSLSFAANSKSRK